MTATDNPEWYGAVGALVVSAISAAISILQRILAGYPASAIWVFSEALAAILAGYLMWDIYPHIQDQLPAWASQHLLIAFAAHLGGRVFKWFELLIEKRTGTKIPNAPRARKPKQPESENHVR